MATIDQLQMMALGRTQSLEKGKTTGSLAGNFKKVLKSVLDVPQNMESFFSEASRTYGVSKKL
ncbi:MAG: Lytic transglycosylase catalytic, partial [Lacrimispora sp.]|nr:Lytic transglycosylase catalytic [Lacrimispora sp.]